MSDGSETKITGNQGVQVIARAAEILRVLKSDNEGLSLGEIAKRTSLPRATVQRIVNALLSEKLVMAVSKQGNLRLGPEIQSLAAAGRLNIADLVRPILEGLAEETGETVDLSVFHDDPVVFVDQVVGTQNLRTVSAVGETFTLTNTANGKATLALLDDATLTRLALREFHAGNKGSTCLDALLAEIRSIRDGQVASDLGEHTEGISAVSVAFVDPSLAIYSISLPVPTHRFKSKKPDLIAALRNALRQVKVILE